MGETFKGFKIEKATATYTVASKIKKANELLVRILGRDRTGLRWRILGHPVDCCPLRGILLASELSLSIYWQDPNMELRVMVFVDGTNLLLEMSKEIGVVFKADKPPKSALNIAASYLELELKRDPNIGRLRRISSIALPVSWQVIRKYWYGSYKGSGEDRDELRDTLRGLGYDPILFKRVKGREKSVDIALTKDMLVNSFNRNFDVAILISGDEDYVQLVQEAKRYGCTIQGAFFERGLSEELKRTVDSMHVLRDPPNLLEMKDNLINTISQIKSKEDKKPLNYKVGKIEAAIYQLDWAIKLFLDHKAYIPAITLAGAAEEILGEAVGSESAFQKLMESLSSKTGIPGPDLSQKYLNKAKNWLKHWKDLKDDEYVDMDLETESSHYILRAVINLFTHDKTVTSETPRFYNWLTKNRKDLFDLPGTDGGFITKFPVT